MPHENIYVNENIVVPAENNNVQDIAVLDENNGQHFGNLRRIVNSGYYSTPPNVVNPYRFCSSTYCPFRVYSEVESTHTELFRRRKIISSQCLWRDSLM